MVPQVQQEIQEIAKLQALPVQAEQQVPQEMLILAHQVNHKQVVQAVLQVQLVLQVNLKHQVLVEQAEHQVQLVLQEIVELQVLQVLQELMVQLVLQE